MYPFSFSKHRVAFLFALLFAGACAAVWGAVYAQTPHSSGVLTFSVLDIGQGDGLYIEGPTGIQLLVDAGPHDGAVLRALPHEMPVGDRSLDAVIETHPDADHMGGLVDILARYTVGAFIEPGIDKHNATIDALEKEVAEQHIPRIIARRGMTLDLGGGARLDILYPDKDVTGYGSKTNDGSIMAHLVYGKTSALLTADDPISVEQHMLSIASSSELKSDILKVGHHGSRFSTGEGFVRVVSPQVAVISVGAHNTYGHPTQRVLDTLAAAKVPVLRTDESGTIRCVSDGAVFSCSPEK